MKKKLLIIQAVFLVFLLCSCTIEAPETSENNAEDASLIQEEIPIIEINLTPYYEQELFQNKVRRITGVKFKTSNRGENSTGFSTQEIATRLLSGDEVPDIFMLVTSDETSASLIEKGYFVDLLLFPKLKEEFDNMFSTYVEASTIDGKVFGLPVMTATRGCIWNPSSSTDEIGWSQDDINTFDDLMQFKEEWDAYSDKKEAFTIDKMLLFNQVLIRYISNNYDYENYSIDLTGQEFIDVLSYTKEMYDSGMFRDDYSYFYDFNFYVESVLVGSQALPSETYPFFPVPQLDGHDDKNLLFTYWLVINPYSKNIDLAAEQLYIVAELMKVTRTYQVIYNNKAFYLDIDKKVDAMFNQYPPDMYPMELSPQYLAGLDDFFSEYDAMFGFPGQNEVEEIFYAFLEGEIEMEEAVYEAQKIIDIVSGELGVAR